MSFARLYDLAIRLAKEIIAKGEGLSQAAGLAKCARIGRDPDNRVQGQRRQAEADPGQVSAD